MLNLSSKGLKYCGLEGAKIAQRLEYLLSRFSRVYENHAICFCLPKLDASAAYSGNRCTASLTSTVVCK